MNGCVYRTADNQCEKFSDPVRNILSWCVGDTPCEARKLSNADRIRGMSDEELAEMLNKPIGYACDGNCHIEENKCVDCIVKWLKKEVDE